MAASHRRLVEQQCPHTFGSRSLAAQRVDHSRTEGSRAECYTPFTHASRHLTQCASEASLAGPATPEPRSRQLDPSWLPPRSSRHKSGSARTRSTMARASTRSRSAEGSGRMPPRVRSKRGVPSSSSSARICRVSGGWEMCRRSAARPRCRSSATATKYSSWAKLTAARYHSLPAARGPYPNSMSGQSSRRASSRSR